MAWVVVLIGVCSVAAAQADWKPAEGPLMTRWGREVTPENAHREYPRPTMVRERWMSLNGLWELDRSDTVLEPNAESPLRETILVPFPVESALSGVGARSSELHYRRRFDVPAEWRGERIWLHIEAFDQRAVAVVNGTIVAERQGGYTRLSADITEALRPGATQQVDIFVSDLSDGADFPRGKQVKEPGGIFYTPSSGIWGSVWIEPVPAHGIAELNIAGDMHGRFMAMPICHGNVGEVRLRVVDDDVILAQGTISSGGTLTMECRSIVPWTPESPRLYQVWAEVFDAQGDVIDRVESYVGFRTVGLVKDDAGITRLGLNGEPYFQVGPLDQGFWPDGLYAAPSDEALRFDIEATKALGFNMTRKHVKIEQERWYWWCDRVGLLVWQDMPSGNNTTDLGKAQFEEELARMIMARRHHPCIAMWVVFNEGWGQYDTERVCLVARMFDDSRLISNASGWTDAGAGDVMDIHVYPGPGMPEPEERRAAVLGEFGGLGLPVEGHRWTEKHWGYASAKDSSDLTDQYVDLLSEVYRLRERGLSAAVYTQLTDVETECNGLYTYDREVLKVDAARVRSVNRGNVPRVEHIVATADIEPAEWRYTTEAPGEGWETPRFDDSAWAVGMGGLGTRGTPGAVIGTVWDTPEIWARRTVRLPAGEDPSQWRLRVHHDEDCEIYINGVQVAALTGYTTSYRMVSIAAEAARELRGGEAVIAVHCRQTRGGQYVDVGLVRVGEKEPRGGGDN